VDSRCYDSARKEDEKVSEFVQCSMRLGAGVSGERQLVSRGRKNAGDDGRGKVRHNNLCSVKPKRGELMDQVMNGPLLHIVRSPGAGCSGRYP